MQKGIHSSYVSNYHDPKGTADRARQGQSPSYPPPPGYTCTWSFQQVVPNGFREVIKKISEEYNNPPIYVLENGFSDNKCCVSDNLRISYLHSYMKAMLSAIYEDKCDVKAFTVWSFLDNFEWTRGYTERFGLVGVNFTDPNRARTPKWSMDWFKNIIETRKLSLGLEYVPNAIIIP